ncbi:MAG: subtilisin family serine protease, partial [Actinobacteria bacterium]|nr:subtilisin family serine protease [Actinomycetota bacterium]
MAEPRQHLSHLLVQDRVTDEQFRRPGRGNPRIRPVEDRAAHGAGRLAELEAAFASIEAARVELPTEDELRALGTVITLEGEGAAYPLKLDSLQQLTAHRRSPRQPRWLLLSVLPADPAAGLPERATVWISDQ